MAEKESGEAFASYRANPEFAPRPPNLGNQKDTDEMQPLTGRDTPRDMPLPQDEGKIVATEADRGKKYLWVILPDGLPVAVESNKATGRPLPSRGYLSHTNLTAGADAHAGGELWFIDRCDKLLVNGASSRYRPRSAAEMTAIAHAFRQMGYCVGSMGWDQASNTPARNYKAGVIEWLTQDC